MKLPTYDLPMNNCYDTDNEYRKVEKPNIVSCIGISIEIINNIFKHRLKKPNFDIQKEWIY